MNNIPDEKTTIRLVLEPGFTIQLPTIGHRVRISPFLVEHNDNNGARDSASRENPHLEKKILFSIKSNKYLSYFGLQWWMNEEEVPQPQLFLPNGVTCDDPNKLNSGSFDSWILDNIGMKKISYPDIRKRNATPNSMVKNIFSQKNNPNTISCHLMAIVTGDDVLFIIRCYMGTKKRSFLRSSITLIKWNPDMKHLVAKYYSDDDYFRILQDYPEILNKDCFSSLLKLFG